MKNILLSIWLLIPLSLSGYSTESSAQSQLASNAANVLVERHNQVLRMIRPDPNLGGDIHMVCLEHVFHEWTSAYLKVLRSSPLKVNDVQAPLNRMAQTWYDSERNMAALDYYRSGIIAQVQSTYERMLGESGAPLGIGKLTLTLEDIKDSVYGQNLGLCLNEKMEKETAGKLNQFLVQSPLPPQITGMNAGKVAWLGAPEGGIFPTLDGNVTAAVGVRIIIAGEAVAGVTEYGDLLRRIQQGRRY